MSYQMSTFNELLVPSASKYRGLRKVLQLRHFYTVKRAGISRSTQIPEVPLVKCESRANSAVSGDTDDRKENEIKNQVP